MDKNEAAIALSTSVHLTPKTIVRFLSSNSFPLRNLKDADFSAVPEQRDRILAAFKNADVQTARVCQKKNVEIIGYWQDEYPSVLKEIPDFPAILYARGNTTLLRGSDAVAVVGSRRPSAYGLSQTARIVRELAPYLCIVSGLALGIDAKAHQSCLTSGGRTIAVLGTPIDRIYPSTNQPLASKILNSLGLIISEYPPGFPIGKYNFPLRNRIIAGLSKAVLVMEAAQDSGSLITASLGAQYNREVFALPGNVDSRMSFGTNRLLQEGANVLSSADALLNILGIERKKITSVIKIDLSKLEKQIVDILGDRPLSFDKIQNLTKIDVAKLNETLINLEIKKMVLRRANGEYGLLTE